jgi:predicted small lipoprotein YifL
MRRAGLFPALAIFALSLALGACGVKGNLESPKAAAAPESAGSESVVVDSSQEKIFMSESRVVGVGAPKIIPTMPPELWATNKSAKGTAAPASAGQRPKSNAPDKPFVLDWLL